MPPAALASLAQLVLPQTARGLSRPPGPPPPQTPCSKPCGRASTPCAGTPCCRSLVSEPRAPQPKHTARATTGSAARAAIAAARFARTPGLSAPSRQRIAPDVGLRHGFRGCSHLLQEDARVVPGPPLALVRRLAQPPECGLQVLRHALACPEAQPEQHLGLRKALVQGLVGPRGHGLVVLGRAHAVLAAHRKVVLRLRVALVCGQWPGGSSAWPPPGPWARPCEKEAPGAGCRTTPRDCVRRPAFRWRLHRVRHPSDE